MSSDVNGPINRIRELEALDVVATAVSRSLDLDDVIREAVDQVLAVTPADACGVYLQDSTSGDLILAAIEGVSDDFAQDPAILRVPAGTGWWAEVARTRDPVTLHDTGAVDRPSLDAVLREELRSTAYVPMLAREFLNGAIVIGSRQRGQFEDRFLRFLSAIGERVGVAVQNARLFDAEQRRVRQLSLINEIGQQLTATLEVDEILDRLVTMLHTELGYQLAAVLLLDSAGRELVLKAIAGESGGLPASGEYRQSVQEGIMGRCVRTGKVALVNDVAQDPAYVSPPGREASGSEVSAPIKTTRGVVGVLNVESSRTNAFDEDDVVAIQTLGDQVGAALENARLFARQQRQLENLETLHDVIRTISSSLDLTEALDRILVELKRVVSYDSAAVWLIDEGRLRALAARQYGDVASDLEVTLPVDDPLFQEAAQSRRAIVLEDAQAAPRFKAVGDTDYVRGWVCAPLVVRERVIGCVTVDSRQIAAYDDEDARTIMTFARQAAVVLENAQLHAQTKRQVEALEALHETSVDLLSRRTIEDLLRSIVQRASDLVGATGGGIYLYDPERGELTVTVSVGIAENYVGRTLKLGEGLAGRVIETGEPLWVADYATWADRPAHYGDAPFRASISVPLKYEDNIIGALSLSEDEPGRTFDESDAKLLSLLAAQAAVAVDNARLYARLSKLATHDGLTDLYNHRHFHELLEYEVARAERYEHPVALLMIDLDGFKDYNDQYGHVAGDDALAGVADILRETCRRSDLIARYGGEEFAVILPQTPGDEASEVAERVCRTVEDRTGEPPFLTPLTVSIGVATYPESALNADDLLLSADQAMYAAKARGKNQVASAGNHH